MMRLTDQQLSKIVCEAVKNRKQFMDPEEIEIIDQCWGLMASGGTRHVYYYEGDLNLVAKVEKETILGREQSNKIEWKVWQIVKDDPEKAKWFAPCVRITKSENVMLQQRVDKLKTVPKMIPLAFALNDDACPYTMRENWGTYNGHPCLLDYGSWAFDYVFETYSDYFNKSEVWELIPSNPSNEKNGERVREYMRRAHEHNDRYWENARQEAEKSNDKAEQSTASLFAE